MKRIANEPVLVRFPFKIMFNAPKPGLFGHVNWGTRSVDDEMDKIGHPKMTRKIKKTRIQNEGALEELQYQVSIVIPTTIFDSRKEMTSFFEDGIRFVIITNVCLVYNYFFPGSLINYLS